MGLKPMNCPAHVPDLQARAALLPRPADPLRRAGPRAPPRAERHAARPAARAPHHPGRRPRLLHRGADRGGGAALPRLRLLHLRRSSASSRGSSCRRGPRSGSAPTRCGTRPRPRCAATLEKQRARVRAQRGRRRLLRPEDRPPHDRRDRPLVAARHRPARLLHARAVRARLHGRRQRRAPPGDDPPRADGLLRALHRHPDRALRRRVPALAGARCRRSCCRSPTATSTYAPRGRRAAARARPARGGRRAHRVGRARRSATPSCARCPYMLVVGDAEEEAGEVAVRRHREGDLGARCRSGEFAERALARDRG